ncbi:hypothetical protein BCO71033_01852 [Burkholderia contaminans]|uniref:Uncharacterized protein n=1 Tax=Burkholderia contaminans TaxID=488447 RepID=A0A6P2WY71_9BURK|nr:hypothetical protein BCO71033_01852 [Burkholderia contaminans]
MPHAFDQSPGILKTMPYLQLDVNDHYSVETKQSLAAKMSETYARMMSVDIRRLSRLQ